MRILCQSTTQDETLLSIKDLRSYEDPTFASPEDQSRSQQDALVQATHDVILSLVFGLTPEWSKEYDLKNAQVTGGTEVSQTEIHMGVINTGKQAVDSARFGIGVFPQNGPAKLSQSMKHARSRSVSYGIFDGATPLSI